jgi:hypothetical protein
MNKRKNSNDANVKIIAPGQYAHVLRDRYENQVEVVAKSGMAQISIDNLPKYF